MIPMAGKRLEDSEITVTTEDEERELLRRQRRSNIILGLIVGGLALFLLVFSFVWMLANGFIPFSEQDVFGGL